MGAPDAKENILKKIRQALVNPVPLPFPASENNPVLYHQPAEVLELTFAREFTSLQGKFAFCQHEADMLHQVLDLISNRDWKRIFCIEDAWSSKLSTTTNLASCDASVTGCELLVARTGSIIMSAAQQSGRTVSVYAPVHICIAYTNQLVFDIKDGLSLLKEKYKEQLPSLITFASGPSRTADIEKTLVTGVHGPAEVYLFLVESPV